MCLLREVKSMDLYDIIIIGAGPAGLTAALYALRANKKVLVLEAKIYGGQIVNASKIENYPAIPCISGFEFANRLYEQVKNMGMELKFETVVRVDENKVVTTAGGNTYQAKAVIIATGAEKRKLHIPGEEEYVGKGVSYCATCDGNFYKKKIVAVVGGGNTALEDAIYLTDLASKVYVIHRRDSFRGEERLYDELKAKENVEFIMNSHVKKIDGTEIVESIEIEDNDGKINHLSINGLFIAVGQEPKNEIFANIIHVNKAGYIESEDGIHTNIPGIYVAGDTREKMLRQLATAVGDGANAATMAIKEMQE